MPNILPAQAVEPIDGTQAVLIAIRAGKLNNREFHLSMSKARGSLFFVIIIYHQTGVNHSRNPAEQGQQQAEEKTGNPPREQHRQRRENYAEKITQRFHSFTN